MEDEILLDYEESGNKDTLTTSGSKKKIFFESLQKNRLHKNFRIPKKRTVSPLLDRAVKELEEMKKEKEKREAEKARRKAEREKRRREARERKAQERRSGNPQPRKLTEAQIQHRQIHNQARQQRNEERAAAGQHFEMNNMIARHAAEIYVNRFLAPGRGKELSMTLL